MSSLYEIHINVAIDTPQDEIKWLWYCKERKIKTIRGINASGLHPVHNMTSKFCSRESNEEAIAHANELANEIAKHFRVIRVKVEGMMMNTCFDKLCLRGDNDSLYWEFHFKVAIGSLAEYEKVVEWRNNHPSKNDLGISISERGETQYPTVTIRLNRGTREEAIGFKNEIVKSLKNGGFHIHDKLQAECSVYDTFPLLDEGWL